MASWSLVFAYFISVAYYLNLFAEFGVSLMPLNDDFHAKALTSTALLLLLVLVLGWTQGFRRWNRWSRFRSG